MIEIEVRKIGSSATPFHGGGYAEVKYIIGVDETEPIEVQRGIVIHEILESYCQGWSHGSIEELTTLILQGFDQLKEEK